MTQIKRQWETERKIDLDTDTERLAERERALERGNNRHAEADRVRQMQAESRHRETYTDSFRHIERAAGICR